jgi:tetratricopeptide (TPR) repeat protein
MLGNLYVDQGRLKEAEAMYQRALEGYEKALRPDHTSTLRLIGLMRFIRGVYRNMALVVKETLRGF